MAQTTERAPCKAHDDLMERIFQKIDEVGEGINRIELSAVKNIADIDKRLALVEVRVTEILTSVRTSNAPSTKIDWAAIAKFIGLAVAAAAAGAGGTHLIQ